jgi:uncharacterized protein YdeI (YjbR/CyaY-like superfamily)
VKRPERAEVSVFPTKAAFRDWMAEHHDSVQELWVGYYRKGVGKPSISYGEAVDVGLAYGWIDGLTYRVDDEVHTNRFTPRRKGSNWSAINVARMQGLIEAGEADPAGIAAFEARTADRTGVYSYESAPRELPVEHADRLRRDPVAWQFWQTQPPSYRRTVTHWVVSAKRPETRDRRLASLLTECAAGRRLRQFTSPSSRADR